VALFQLFVNESVTVAEGIATDIDTDGNVAQEYHGGEISLR